VGGSRSIAGDARVGDASEAMPPLPEVVREFRHTPAAKRTALLQSYIGPHSNSPAELHRRALLVTALNEAELWPPGPRPTTKA